MRRRIGEIGEEVLGGGDQCVDAAVEAIGRLSRPLNSGVLSAALTAPVWTDRLLGRNETTRAPVRCVWLATANNPVLTRELARRSIRIRLDPKVKEPWLRGDWAHPRLRSWADQHRGELVWSALTLIQTWIAAGQPEYSGKLLGSFERWSTVLGGILETVGIAGFLGNLAQLYEAADPEAGVWEQFLSMWWETFGGNKVGVADLFDLALRIEGLALTGQDKRAQQTSLGTQIAHRRDQVIGSYQVLSAGIEHKAKRWKLQPTCELPGKEERGNNAS